MLLGQRLGRRHEGGLAPRLDGAQQRVERDDRLARSDVALQQATHRLVAPQVGVDLGDGRLLVLGERKGQPGHEPRDQLARRGQRHGPGRGRLGRLVQEQADLHEQQLLEHQPLAGDLRLGEAARRVDGEHGVGLGRQVLGGAEAARQGVGQPPRRPRTSCTSARSTLAETASLAGYTGTRPSVWTVSPSSSARISCARTTNVTLLPLCRHEPRRLSTIPGSSVLASHAWLNQTAMTPAVSSRTVASTRFTRRRAVRWADTRTTVARIVASSPSRSSAIALRSVKSS